MKIDELEIDIQRSKERSPETFNEIVNINCEWKRNVEKYFEQTKKE